MPADSLKNVIHHLRTITRNEQATRLADADLVERFITQRDEAAFEQLVHRHAAMVLGVCQRILRNATDAEDAFQATFLVLVRKANTIRPRSQVANWLHGVAHKTALKAKAMSTQRRAKERAAGTTRWPHTRDDTWDCLLEILDDELRALPDKYRTPLVLCDLEGLSYREAAARLGFPQGTLSGRLTRARDLLARRLARRCPHLPPAAFTALLAHGATVSVPPSLRTLTIRAGTLLAGGAALAESTVSSKVALLTQGVLKMLLLSKLKLGVGVLIIVAAIAFVGSIAAPWQPASAAPPGDSAALDNENPQARPSTVGTMKRSAQSHEAVFVLRGMDRSHRSVSLLVARTTGPVISLPVRDNVRVFPPQRSVGIEGLQPGCRIAIQLDPGGRIIQQIWTLERPASTVILKSAKDLHRLQGPSEADVIRALDRPHEVPTILKVSRDNIQVVKEELARDVGSPTIFPLVGEASLCHSHWKCTVYYDEIVEANKPYRLISKRPRVEVVYFEKDYLIPTQ